MSRLRLLPILAGGYALGVALADRFPGHGQLALVLAVGGLALAATPWPRAGGLGRAVALALAFAALGFHALSIRLGRAAEPGIDGERVVDARVASAEPFGSANAGGWRIRLEGARAADADPDPLPREVVLVCWRRDPEAVPIAGLQPGDRIRARLRLTPLTGRSNPGGRNRERGDARRGVGARARLLHPALLHRAPRSAEGPLDALRRWRAELRGAFRARGRGGSLLGALALGDGRAIRGADRAAAASLGIVHLLAVSGLHVAFVLGGAYALSRRLALRIGPLARAGDPRIPALLCALAACAVYTVLAGGRAPVVRACVLATCIGVGVALGRQRSSPEALAAAALSVLVADPAALFEPGAQLSFAACAGLLAARPLRPREKPDRHRLAGLATPLVRLAGHTAVAVAATAPVLAAHGAAASPWALLTNLVAVPWCGFVLLPLSFSAVLAAAFGASIAGTPESGWLDLAARVAELHLDGVVATASWLPGTENVGFGALAPRASWTIALALLPAVATLRVRRAGARIALCASVLLWIHVAPAADIDPAPPRVVALDVGQGDAMLVQGRTGTLLVDAGVAVPDGPDLGATVVVPALRALGVERLDLVAASHADLDHRGGLPSVLRALPVARVWLPYGALDDPAFAAVVAAARATGAVLEEKGAGGTPLQAGDLRVEPLWPVQDDVAGSRNDRSLTLRVALAGRSVLLPGDLEAGAERRLLASGASLRADVLKLAHHGSRTSSTAAWLAAVHGAVAVASAPRSGRFDMPHAEVIARTRAAGYALWWTGRDGAVLIGLGPMLRVRGWRR